jgi:phage-related tail fiber protein
LALTIEQIVLNHAISTNIKDADTISGVPIEGISLVGHKHNAADITTGVMDPARLPLASGASKGIVQLSNSLASTATDIAATANAVKVLKDQIDGKAASSHKHNPPDINGGEFTDILVAHSNTSYTTKQIRNIYLSTSAPSNNTGENGDIWFQYE